MSSLTEYPCDVCGGDAAAEIEVARHYTGDRPLHVCKNCGFVYVRLRRDLADITGAWAKYVFGDTFEDGKYTARIPAVKARHIYVAEFIDTTVGLRDKSLCDIGAGEGVFLQMLTKDYGARPFGVEPSAENCEAMRAAGIACFHGMIEDYLAAPECRSGGFDLASIVWALENTGSCRGMMAGARRLLRTGGQLTVATSSRILVPFKKPMHYFLNPLAPDLHPFFFSANALRNLFAAAGFAVRHVNRYIDTDYLVMAGEALERPEAAPPAKDDWREVVDFFRRWHEDTRDHYAGS